jgi:hypothetical protein
MWARPKPDAAGDLSATNSLAQPLRKRHRVCLAAELPLSREAVCLTRRIASDGPPTVLQKSPQRAGEEVGWGGWTRTNTILINSEVSYRLDHAPTVRRKFACGAPGTAASQLGPAILSNFEAKIARTVPACSTGFSNRRHPKGSDERRAKAEAKWVYRSSEENTPPRTATEPSVRERRGCTSAGDTLEGLRKSVGGRVRGRKPAQPSIP